MSLLYRLIEVGDLDARLVEAWRAIQECDDRFESPFFCPEFTQMVGSVRRDVRVVVIEASGKPVGFFPHQRAWLGRGRPVGGPLSDYHGVIAPAGGDWSLDALMRTARLSVWKFDHLVGDVERFEPHVTARATSPRIDLGGGYERYVQDRREAGSDLVAKTEKSARKMARELGALRFTLHEEGEEAIRTMISWKSEQYRETGTSDAFGVHWTGDLLRRIAATQTAGFAGVCSVLRAGDRIVAVHVGMRSARVLHYWFPAYDPAHGKYSTGVILILRMAQALAASGVQTIDLGKGDSPYKQRLMTGAVELREGLVASRSLAATAHRWRERVEANASRGGAGAARRLPLRVLRRIERGLRFR